MMILGGPAPAFARSEEHATAPTSSKNDSANDVNTVREITVTLPVLFNGDTFSSMAIDMGESLESWESYFVNGGATPAGSDLRSLQIKIKQLREELQLRLNTFLGTSFAQVETVNEAEEIVIDAVAAQFLSYYKLVQRFETLKAYNQVDISPDHWLTDYGIELNLQTSLRHHSFVKDLFKLGNNPTSPFDADLTQIDGGWVLTTSLNPGFLDEVEERQMAYRHAGNIVEYSRFIILKMQYMNLARLNGMLRRSTRDLPDPQKIPAIQENLQKFPPLARLKYFVQHQEWDLYRQTLSQMLVDEWALPDITPDALIVNFIDDQAANEMIAALQQTQNTHKDHLTEVLKGALPAQAPQIFEADQLFLANYKGRLTIETVLEILAQSRYSITMEAVTRQIRIFASNGAHREPQDLVEIRNELIEILSKNKNRYIEKLKNQLPISQERLQHLQAQALPQALYDNKMEMLDRLDMDILSIQNITTDDTLPVDLEILSQVRGEDVRLSGFHARKFNELIREGDFVTAGIGYHQFIMDNLELIGVPESTVADITANYEYQSLFDAFSQVEDRGQRKQMLRLLEAGNLFGFFNPVFMNLPSGENVDLTELVNLTLDDLDMSRSEKKSYQMAFAEKAASMNHMLVMQAERSIHDQSCLGDARNERLRGLPLWKIGPNFKTVAQQSCALDYLLLESEKKVYETFKTLTTISESSNASQIIHWLGRQFDMHSQTRSNDQHIIIQLLATTSLYTAALQTYSFFDTDLRQAIETYNHKPQARALFDKFYEDIIHPVFWGVILYQVVKFGLRFAAPGFQQTVSGFEKRLMTPIFGASYASASIVLMTAVLGYFGLKIQDTYQESQLDNTLSNYHFSAFDDGTTFVKTEDWKKQHLAYKKARNELLITGVILAGFMVGIVAARAMFRAYMRNFARSGGFVKKHKEFIQTGLGFQPGKWSLTREHLEGSLRAQMRRIDASSELSILQKQRLKTRITQQFIQIEQELDVIGKAFVNPPPHLSKVVQELGLMDSRIVGPETGWWAHQNRLAQVQRHWESQFHSKLISYTEYQTKQSQMHDVIAHARAQVHWYKNSQEAVEVARAGVARVTPKHPMHSDFLSSMNEFRWTSSMDLPDWAAVKQQNDWLSRLDTGFRFKIVERGGKWKLEAYAVENRIIYDRIAGKARKMIENADNGKTPRLGYDPQKGLF